MREISLSFNRKEFEYDVYTLIGAFYPGCRIRTWYVDEEEPEGNFDCECSVTYGEGQITFGMTEGAESSFAVCRLEDETDRTETKNRLKRMIYRFLAEKTGHELPWGDLTGIRPTKIPMHLLEEGWKKCGYCPVYERDVFYQSGENGPGHRHCQPGEGDSAAI